MHRDRGMFINLIYKQFLFYFYLNYSLQNMYNNYLFNYMFTNFYNEISCSNIFFSPPNGRLGMDRKIPKYLIECAPWNKLSGDRCQICSIVPVWRESIFSVYRVLSSRVQSWFFPKSNLSNRYFPPIPPAIQTSF